MFHSLIYRVIYRVDLLTLLVIGQYIAYAEPMAWFEDTQKPRKTFVHPYAFYVAVKQTYVPMASMFSPSAPGKMCRVRVFLHSTPRAKIYPAHRGYLNVNCRFRVFVACVCLLINALADFHFEVYRNLGYV